MAIPTPFTLPYTDTKPVGSADFYFAINSTFRFILRKLGRESWIRYLQDLGREYFAPVNRQWLADGLPAVAGYWRAFFAAENPSKVGCRMCEPTLHIARQLRRGPRVETDVADSSRGARCG